MGAKNEEAKATLYYKLKIDNDKNSKTYDQLRFIQNVKNGGSWGEGERFKDMTGYLKEVKPKEYQTEKKKEKAIEMIFRDDENPDQNIVIGANFNNITCNLINSLLGTENLGLLTLQCGISKKDGKEWPALYIKNNGDKTQWKYQPAEIPKVKKIYSEAGDEIGKDSSMRDKFIWQMVEDLAVKLKGNPAPASFMDKDSAETGSLKPNQLPGDAEDGLPF